jgi:intracellular multiplication protein IcmV
MGFWRKTVKVLGHAVDFRVDRWIALEELKRSTSYFWRQSKRLFKKNPEAKPETFEEAVERLHLTLEALLLQKKRYQSFFFLFLVMASALLTYMVVIAKMGNWRGAMVSFSLAIYALSNAFRFHFWCFQITQKKLGCKTSEWFKHNLKMVQAYRVKQANHKVNEQ